VSLLGLTHGHGDRDRDRHVVNSFTMARMNRTPAFLLNFAHALDHLFLLIFATAVAAIAADFGVARWEDLMPYTTGAFVMFGLASVPAGRWGDLWGRRRKPKW